jgi:DNA-binding CsgD family transcriptional regulator
MSATFATSESQIMPIGSTPVVRPFHIDVPDENPVVLRERVVITRWLDRFAELIDELRIELEEGTGAPRMHGTGHLRPPASHISPREREVLSLVVAGRSNREIAEVLFISPYTVKSHMTSLLTKLDAENRAQLAGIAMKRRILDDA